MSVTRSHAEAIRFLQEALDAGNACFSSGDPQGAIRRYESALGPSFIAAQHIHELRPIFQTLWANKAMAHQQLRQREGANEAAAIAGTLAEAERRYIEETWGDRPCRRCATALGAGTSVTHPSLDIVRCRRCQYQNVVGGHSRVVPLPESLAIAGVQLERTGEDARVWLSDAVRALVARVVEWIDAEPAAAARRIWHDLEHAEETLAAQGAQQSSVARSVHPRAAALIAGMVSRHGPVEIESDAEPSGIMAETVWTVASDAAMLGTELRGIVRGEWTAGLEDGEIVLSPTPYHLQLNEWSIDNAEHRGELRTDDRLDAVFDELLTLTRGYTVRQLASLLTLVGDSTRQYSPDGTRLRLGWPQRDCLTPAESAMLDDWALTPERLRRFTDPFYFDLGAEASGPQSDTDVAVSLVMNGWPTYYPVVPVLRHGKVHYLVPFHAFDIALTNFVIFKNRLIEALVDGARTTVDRQGARRLVEVRRSANRIAEERAAEALAAAGWHVCDHARVRDPRNADRWEEIDVLAGRQVAGGTVVLVGEVKDFDLGLHRSAARTNFERRVGDATAQLARKAAFVEQSWRAIVCDQARCDVPADQGAVMLSVIITPGTLPLAFFEGCAVIAEPDLATLADRLEREPELTRDVLRHGWKALS